MLGAGRGARLVGRSVDREHARGAQGACQSHRQRQPQIGIGMALAVDAHGCELAFDGAGGLHRQAGVAAIEGHHGAIGQALRHAHHHQRQLLQLRRVTPLAQLVAHQAGHGGAAQSFVAAHRQAGQPGWRQVQRQRLERGPGHAAGAQHGDQRADRGADDEVGHQAEFVQRLDHADVDEAPRPARAQHPGQARLARQRPAGRRGRPAMVFVGVEGAAGQQRCSAEQAAAADLWHKGR